MADIQLRSLQSIIGSMVSRILAETDANDVSPGSFTLTLLEAAASSDFQQEAKLLQLMALRNVDRVSGLDLENLATEMGVTPNRIGASSSRVFLTVKETAFSKVSSTIFAGAQAPVAGESEIIIVDGANFDPAGTLYIGRGTQTSEVADYVSITDNGSYWTLSLAAPLSKDHLIGEEIVMSQGGDRIISDGSIVTSEAIGLSPAVQFKVLLPYTLLDGEDTVTGVEAVAEAPGNSGNVAKGKINQFISLPWSTASVENADPASGGRDPETDTELRERIKDRVHVLSAGTERALIRGVVGQIDDEENKRVVSSFLRKPTSNTEQTLLFIDDGTGFAPTFSGVGEEVVVTSAAGTEKFLQLQRWPLVKAQVASVATEPFKFTGFENLRFEVDGEFEEKQVPSTDFRTIGVVTAQEIAEAINNTFTIVEARAKNGQLFISATKDDPEYVRVGSASGTDGNSLLKLPVTNQYTLRLYKNDRLLAKNGSQAFIQSISRDRWATFTSSETLQLRIDGIDSPVITYVDAEFGNYTNSGTIDGASISDWAIMINRKFIGVTASPTDSGSFVITSNKGYSSAASVEVIGGTLAEKLFEAGASSAGQEPEYTLNRLLGQIELAKPLAAGDNLKAGTTNTRGLALTSSAAEYELSLINNSPAEMVFVADAPYTPVVVGQLNAITFAAPNATTQRITGLTGQFSNVRVNDFAHFYATPRNLNGSLGVILIVKAVDPAGAWVEFFDSNPMTGSATLDGFNIAIKFFRTEGLPQLVRFPSGTSIASSLVRDAINDQTIGMRAEILDSGRIQIYTTRYSGTGALAVPSLVGKAINFGIEEANYESNDPHTAAIESEDLVGLPSGRIAVLTADNTAPYTTLDATTSEFSTKQSSNRPIMAYLGSSSRVVRQPEHIVTPTEISLRDELPAQNVGLGPDFRGTSFSGVEFGGNDNMVFIIDNDADKKTFNIPMYVEGTIASPSVPTTSQFDVADATGELLGTSVRWDGMRFEDYKVWFQSRATLAGDTSNSALDFRSVEFGPNGERINVGYTYPTQDNSPAQASFAIEPLSDQIQVSVRLASSIARPINLLPGKRLDIEVTGNTVKYIFMPPTSLAAVQIGDVISVNDSSFPVEDQGSARVSALTSLVDSGNAFEYTAANTIHAANLPSFTIQPGDRIVVASAIVKVISVTDAQTFVVDLANAWTGLVSGTASRITVTGLKFGASDFSGTVAASDSVKIFQIPPGANTVSTLGDLVKNTAGVKDLVTTANATGSDGSGSVTVSTEDRLANGSRFQALENGEGYVQTTSTLNPGISLKTAMAQAPKYGEKIRLIPSTPRNVADHLARKQISGLAVTADVELVDQARRVQISTKTPGGLGQVFAVGGRALGDTIIAIRGNAQELNSSRALLELDRSSIEFLAPGQTIKVSQVSRARKHWTVSDPDEHTIAQVSVNSITGITTFQIDAPLVHIFPYTQTTGARWAVRRLGRGRTRFELFSGTATIPSALKVNDWVYVGTGSAYAGHATTAEFSSANRGWAQIREVDQTRGYFDVDSSGIEEIVTTQSTSFIFTSYHSARPGDQLSIGIDSPFVSKNRGTFTITQVPTENSVEYINTISIDEGPMELGEAGATAISVLDQGYSSYRKVILVSPKPSDPARRSLVLVEPGFDLSSISEGQGGRITLPLRLGFGSDPVPGVNGYNYWIGLKRRIQRVVDGYASDPSSFPGIGAAGVSIEVREPQIRRVSVGLKIKTAQGVSLTSLTDGIKSTIAGYINSLGLGQDVILSEVISITQEIPGVEAVVMQTPSPSTERITVNDNSIARIATADISLS